VSRPSLPFAVLACCLLASGAAALIYEVLWLREMSLVMGHTVYALAAILTAFLGGLTLGAFLGGRWTERRGASLSLYAGLELAIAGSALLVPFLTRGLSPVIGVVYRHLGDAFAAYNLVQFLLCGLVVLPPTICMGATLPIVSEILLRSRREIGVDAGALYAANSSGGVLGAGAAGFVLLPALGMNVTALAAAALNVAAAAAAYWLARRDGGERTAREHDAGTRDREIHPGDGDADAQAAWTATPRPGGGSGEARAWPAPGPRLLIALYAAFGFANLALEVGWARLVSLSIGSTTQGFTIILVTYIAGLALGSFVLPRLPPSRREPVGTIVALHATIALWSLGSLAYLGRLPERIAHLPHGGESHRFTALLATETVLVTTTIAIPTLAMGGVFPVMATLVRRSVPSSGRAVGLSYAANSIGNIVGAFVAGFVLVPAFGMRGTIVLSAVVTGAVALGYLVPAMQARRAMATVTAAALATAIAVMTRAAPAWNRQLVTSGPYFHGQDLGTLIDYREGASAVVAVKQIGNQRIMQVGGIREATSGSSLPNFLGHLAMLVHGPERDVLVVGLGSGTTLASVLKHPVEHVDCVEISPEVVAAAREHFAALVGSPLDDPRVRVIIGDGRNHVRHSGLRYDVIVSQPSYPWVSGAGGLFTREFFRDVHDHLMPGGVATAWFTAESEPGKRSVIHAWTDAFAEAYLFESKNVDALLLGLRDPAPLSAATIAAGFRIPAVQRDLAQLGTADPAALLGSLVAGPAALRRYGAGAPSNTDENGWVEFQGLRDLTSDAASSRARVEREDPARYVDATLASEDETRVFTQRLEAVYASKR